MLGRKTGPGKKVHRCFRNLALENIPGAKRHHALQFQNPHQPLAVIDIAAQ